MSAHQPTLPDADLALEDFERSLKPKGRPKGSRNRHVDQAEAAPTTCRACGSSKRGPYFNLRVVDVAGVCPRTGRAYTSIEYRRTKCQDCGQHRDDRTLVTRGPE